MHHVVKNLKQGLAESEKKYACKATPDTQRRVKHLFEAIRLKLNLPAGPLDVTSAKPSHKRSAYRHTSSSASVLAIVPTSDDTKENKEGSLSNVVSKRLQSSDRLENGEPVAKRIRNSMSPEENNEKNHVKQISLGKATGGSTSGHTLRLMYDSFSAQGASGRHIGRVDSNEDRLLMMEEIPVNGCSFFLTGILDGHGGNVCVDFVLSKLTSVLSSQLCTAASHRWPLEDQRVMGAVGQTFKTVDDLFLENSESSSGACCSIIIFWIDPVSGVQKVLTAHAGDCRTLMVREAKKIGWTTRDHTPGRSEERIRLEEAGARVVCVRNTWRVKHPNSDKTGLAVSRAFGDRNWKIHGRWVMCKPEIAVHDVTIGDWCLVLATDGVAAFLSNQQIADMLRKDIKAKDIVQRSREMGSQDDSTCMVLRFSFRKMDKPRRKIES